MSKMIKNSVKKNRLEWMLSVLGLVVAAVLYFGGYAYRVDATETVTLPEREPKFAVGSRWQNEFCVTDDGNLSPVNARCNTLGFRDVTMRPAEVLAEGTGYSVDQLNKANVSGYRFTMASLYSAAGAYGAFRDTIAGTAGGYTCTGKVYAYFSVTANQSQNILIDGDRGATIGSGVICTDMTNGTLSNVSVHGVLEP